MGGGKRQPAPRRLRRALRSRRFQEGGKRGGGGGGGGGGTGTKVKRRVVKKRTKALVDLGVELDKFVLRRVLGLGVGG